MGENSELNNAIKCTEYVECEILGDLALVEAVVEKLRAFCQRNGLPPRLWSNIELATVEGLNNAIVHGCAGAPGASVRLRWSWEQNAFEIQISDQGDFQPSQEIATLPDDPLAESGRGRFLIATMMDEVQDRIVEGRHVLVLRKRAGAKVPRRESDPESESILRATTEDLSASYESLSALFRFGEQLATAQSFEDFVRHVLDQLIAIVQANEAYARVVNRSGTLTVFYSEEREESFRRRGKPAPPLPELSPLDDAHEMLVFRQLEPSSIEDCSRLPAADPLWREAGCAYACPIYFQDHVLGVLTIIRPNAASYFTAGQISIIGVVADFLGIARTIANLQEQRQSQQRAMRELEIAAEIQQSLLPKSFPDSASTRIFGISQTASEVGGDYFDALPVGERGVLVAIADVMGKGMPAALLATILRATLHARLDLADNPGRLLSTINRQISVDLAKLDMFITAQVAFLSHENREIVFASAGHCPVLYYRKGSDRASQFKVGGIPLGVLDDVAYESVHLKVAPGDRFVFLTDGLYEAQSPRGEMLGLDRIALQIPRLWSEAPHTFCGSLLDYVREFSGGAHAADDRTVLVVEYL